MSAEQRVAEAVRVAVDAIPVTVPPPAGAIRARAGAGARRPARGWAPILAAAAVVGLAAITVVAPTVIQHQAAAPAPDRPRTVLPTEIAGLSLLTAKVSDAPPGRVVALFHQGSFGMSVGLTQVVVLGADGKTYRRLDRAEDRGHTGDDGERTSAEALLAPDGLKVAVTVSARATTTVDIVDLTTGRPRTITLPTASAVRPLAWTPDGERLLVTRQEPAGADGIAPEIRLAVIGVPEGTVRDIAVPDRTSGGTEWRATIAEDGLTALVSDGAIGGVLRSVHLEDGSIGNLVPMGEGQDLVTLNAMSPNERNLAVVQRALGALRLAVIEFGSEGIHPGEPIYLSEVTRFLGWQSVRTVLLAEEGGGGQIMEAPLDGGAPTPLSRFDAGGLQRVSGIQLALGGPGRLTAVDPGGPDRGPWPWWFRLTLGGFVLAVLAMIGWRHRRRAG